MPKFVTVNEFAAQHRVSSASVRQRCERGTIPGAIRVGADRRTSWLIPEDAEFRPRTTKPLPPPENTATDEAGSETDSPKYLSTTEFAKLHGRSPVAIGQACAAGRIPGAVKHGQGRRATWIIPADAEITDNRLRTGKYIGFRQRIKHQEAQEDE